MNRNLGTNDSTSYQVCTAYFLTPIKYDNLVSRCSFNTLLDDVFPKMHHFPH